jgi:hypothetical protein
MNEDKKAEKKRLAEEAKALKAKVSTSFWRFWAQRCLGGSWEESCEGTGCCGQEACKRASFAGEEARQRGEEAWEPAYNSITGPQSRRSRNAFSFEALARRSLFSQW